MTHRIVRHLGWILWLLDLMVIVAAIVLFTQTPGSNENGAFVGTFAMVAAFFAFPTMGALIISRRPDNTVGWIFCAIGLGTATTSFSAAFADFALATHTDASVTAGLITVMGNAVWPMNLGLGVMLLFLFPNGRLPSPRWRPIFWLAVLAMVLNAVASAFIPGPLESNGRMPNPLGIQSAAGLLNAVVNVSQALIVPCAIAAVASIIVRYVKARDTQRQQIKWFAFGAMALAVIITLSVIFIPDGSPFSNVTFALGIVMLPIGAGIGVLRYRLFDIDVIINRTLVYGLLTAVLAGVYFLGVVGVQSLVNVVSGRALAGSQGSQSPVLIVITTLLIAALFQPLRRRFQQFIDRRFYRSRYDAKKTLDKFGASLRSQIELDHLTDHLLETVEQTMRPAHVSLWLRMPESERQR
ncbi:MAG TPA: hypothetical protein VH591_16060 [Ktedonobacterales bacterium]|jgi:hypothetical protein